MNGVFGMTPSSLPQMDPTRGNQPMYTVMGTPPVDNEFNVPQPTEEDIPADGMLSKVLNAMHIPGLNPTDSVAELLQQLQDGIGQSVPVDLAQAGDVIISIGERGEHVGFFLDADTIASEINGQLTPNLDIHSWEENFGVSDTSVFRLKGDLVHESSKKLKKHTEYQVKRAVDKLESFEPVAKALAPQLGIQPGFLLTLAYAASEQGQREPQGIDQQVQRLQVLKGKLQGVTKPLLFFAQLANLQVVQPSAVKHLEQIYHTHPHFQQMDKAFNAQQKTPAPKPTGYRPERLK